MLLTFVQYVRGFVQLILDERKMKESELMLKCIKYDIWRYLMEINEFFLNFKSTESLVWANCTNILSACFQNDKYKLGLIKVNV